MMELRQLRYFVTLAETLHFGRAAERLHITQPPLSRQIAALEATLGTPLFERHSRSVAMTPAGEQFLDHARRLLSDLELAVHATRMAADAAHRELRIGFTMYAAWNLLPGLVRRYGDAYPADDLTLNETLPRDLQQALMTGRVDVGISFPLLIGGSLCYRPLYREPLCAVLPQGHPRAGDARLAVAALARESFVTFPASTAPTLHEAVMTCCRRARFEPKVRLETHLQQTIVNLVAAGLGVALVPDSMRRIRLPGAVFLPLDDSPAIEQGIYWHPHNTNPALADFLADAGH
ncbi:LysR substrate-binding domain-containing protein [Salinicola salarius]|uniref:LysR family transcriptional regulator n=1 Tax=Salinicola salarius TaxID=430457 RepID=UPI0023E43F9D|nr:LysR substrate-binding domain-containing protein [Salinicola salarius]MDF3917901.1 LysR substrate-binding domain-containing protein [Salinicola salarius]